MNRPVSFPVQTPVVIAARNPLPAATVPETVSEVRVTVAQLADAFACAAALGARMPLEEAKLVIAQALKGLVPDGTALGAELLDPERMREAFLAIAERAEPNAAPAPAVAREATAASASASVGAEQPRAAKLTPAERALVPFELALARREPTSTLLWLLADGRAPRISDVGGRAVLTMVHVLQERAAAGDKEASPAALQRALCRAVAEDSSLVDAATRAILRELVRPGDAYLAGIATADHRLRDDAKRAFAALLGTRHTTKSQMLANTLDADAVKTATAAGARHILDALAAGPLLDVASPDFDKAHPVIRAASWALDAFVRGTLPLAADGVRYHVHLSPDALKAAMAVAYGHIVGRQGTDGALTHLAPYADVPTQLKKLKGFLEAGDALALRRLAEQVLPAAPESSLGARLGLARLWPSVFAAHDGAAVDRMLARISEETFRDDGRFASPELKALVGWLKWCPAFERALDGEQNGFPARFLEALRVAKADPGDHGVWTRSYIERQVVELEELVGPSFLQPPSTNAAQSSGQGPGAQTKGAPLRLT